MGGAVVERSRTACYTHPGTHMDRAPLRRALSLLALSVGLSLALPACAPSVSVSYAYNRKIDFGRYRSFAMALPNKPVSTASTDFDPFILQRLRQLTYQALKGRGLVPADPATADLVVNVLAAEDTRTEVYTYSNPRYFGMGPYWSTWGAPWAVTTRTYQEAKLVIDLVDRSEEAVVWRGVGQRLWSSTPPDEELVDYIERILSHFPPGKPGE